MTLDADRKRAEVLAERLLKLSQKIFSAAEEFRSLDWPIHDVITPTVKANLNWAISAIESALNPQEKWVRDTTPRN